jgi:hypothetical protein
MAPQAHKLSRRSKRFMVRKDTRNAPISQASEIDFKIARKYCRGKLPRKPLRRSFLQKLMVDKKNENSILLRAYQRLNWRRKKLSKIYFRQLNG